MMPQIVEKISEDSEVDIEVDKLVDILRLAVRSGC